MRDKTDNEVGGFAVTLHDDLLFVTDVVLVKQKVTVASVEFDDTSVADFFDDHVEKGLKPEQFARIWLHTHPGHSPSPSITDVETFQRVFGRCDWSVMFILAQNGSSYARLHFKAGPGGDMQLPVSIDYSCPFDASDFKSWAQEYQNLVQIYDFSKQSGLTGMSPLDALAVATACPKPPLCTETLLSQLDMMHPAERESFMDELAVRSDFWDEQEGGVFYE
jgi:hypothetical protein